MDQKLHHLRGEAKVHTHYFMNLMKDNKGILILALSLTSLLGWYNRRALKVFKPMKKFIRIGFMTCLRQLKNLAIQSIKNKSPL